MLFIIGLLTAVLVVDCAALIFLVLIQLPKKEAGAGLAFGGAATDALFGAGSGNVLTKITKYAATIFFVLAIVLAVMQNKFHSRGTSEFEQKLAQPGSAPATLPAQTPPAAAPSKPAAPVPVMPLTSSTNLLSTTPAEAPAPAAAATNAAPAPASPK